MRQERTYDTFKRGFYNTRRFPWGSNKGPASEGTRQNPYGMLAVHYNFFTAVGNFQAFTRNDQRRFLEIQNMSLANDISVAFGSAASVNDGITLTPGQVAIYDVGCPTDSLNIFCAVAGQRVAILEGY